MVAAADGQRGLLLAPRTCAQERPASSVPGRALSSSAAVTYTARQDPGGAVRIDGSRPSRHRRLERRIHAKRGYGASAFNRASRRFRSTLCAGARGAHAATGNRRHRVAARFLIGTGMFSASESLEKAGSSCGNVLHKAADSVCVASASFWFGDRRTTPRHPPRLHGHSDARAASLRSPSRCQACCR